MQEDLKELERKLGKLETKVENLYVQGGNDEGLNTRVRTVQKRIRELKLTNK